MTNKEKTKSFFFTLACFLLAGVCLVSSIGSINYGLSGEPFYLTCGVLNFATLYPIAKIVISQFNKSK